MSADTPLREQLRRQAMSGGIVIKIGSNVLAKSEGHLDPKTVRRLADEIAPLCSVRRWPYIVSSGAIAVGRGILGLKARPKTMPGLQATAAVGQSKLVEAWSGAFRRYEIPVAQVLLTHADVADRKRFLNARQALHELARRKAIPVINENDTVSTEEIAFGDNDGLAAQITNLVDASVLVLMSVAPGLLDASGTIIDEAIATDPSLDALIRPERSAMGTGGMTSKLKAARAATSRGTMVAIIDGHTPGQLGRLLLGERVGTVLGAAESQVRLRSRAHWIAHTLRPKGRLLVDDGCAKALLAKKSLLASGVVAIEGDFDEGEAVDIVAHQNPGLVIARGLCRYGQEDARALTQGVAAADAAPVVHKDDLVLF